jgi:hypothetical protein
MEPFLFPDEFEGHVQDGFCLTDMLGHYINTGELPGVLSVGPGPVVGQVLLPEWQGCGKGQLPSARLCALIRGWIGG